MCLRAVKKTESIWRLERRFGEGVKRSKERDTHKESGDKRSLPTQGSSDGVPENTADAYQK